MRKFGFLFLFAGFVWLAILQLGLYSGGGTRSLVLAQYATLSRDPNHLYRREEVEAKIRDSVASAYSHAPSLLAPAVVMLLGGLLIAHGARRGYSENAV